MKKHYKRKINPKKSLGQHFLKDAGIAMDISEILAENDLPVLEIGPGTGALTEHLLKIYGSKLHLVELDHRSYNYLRTEYNGISNQIYHLDFLKMDISEYFPGGVNIIGNFPYNISSQILFKVLGNFELVPQFGGMFQKEVAQRICAEPDNKQYGQLTILRELYYDAEYLFDVPKEAFDPPPKVVSGVIRLTRNERDLSNLDIKELKKIIKTAFLQRRKKLRNSLKQFFSEEQLQHSIFDKRPEQLSLDKFIGLVEKIKKRN